MSIVIGFSFPEEAILISDSRISFVKNDAVVKAEDTLQKIFPLTPNLAVGFTSNNVNLTYGILRKVDDYIKNQAKVTYTYPLLQKLQRVAAHEYSSYVKSKKSPAMEFVYAGLLTDRTLRLPEPYVMSLFFSGKGGAVPEPIGKALMTMRDGYLTIPAPTPIVVKQSFPSGDISPMCIWGYLTSGSGQSIEVVFDKEYPNLFTTTSDIGMRGNMIRLNCDDFINKSGIATIGGGVQVLRLNTKGTSPINLSLASIDSHGNTKEIQSMQFNGKDWVYSNFETGKKNIISSMDFSVDKQLATIVQ